VLPSVLASVPLSAPLSVPVTVLVMVLVSRRLWSSWSVLMSVLVSTGSVQLS
jgi:hypothetical protein